MDVFERTATWNFVRDNKDFSAILEMYMIDEEVKEAMTSDSPENLAKELADIIFVTAGSLYKLTGSASKAREIMNIVCNHNDNKGMVKDEKGKVKKVKQPKCEPKIKEVLERGGKW